MSNEDYRTIKLPVELVKAIEECIKKNPKRGYKSVAEFIKVAVNNYLDILCPSPEAAQRQARIDEVIKRLDRLEKRK